MWGRAGCGSVVQGKAAGCQPMKHSAGTNGSHAQSANSPIVKPQAPGSRGEGRGEASWQKVAGKSGEMAGPGPDPE